MISANIQENRYNTDATQNIYLNIRSYLRMFYEGAQMIFRCFSQQNIELFLLYC